MPADTSQRSNVRYPVASHSPSKLEDFEDDIPFYGSARRERLVRAGMRSGGKQSNVYFFQDLNIDRKDKRLRACANSPRLQNILIAA